jgi:hypothetical protein
MSGLSELHLCVDRLIPERLRPAGATMERAVTDAADILRQLPDLMDTQGLEPARAALLVAKKWPNGTTLKCRFLDGSDTQHSRVEEKAHMWEQYIDLRFKFVDTTDEQIRISFSEDGSWSAVGTDCLNESYFPKHQPTMNYGWLADDTDDQEYERVVVHEFGHAIGALHEHQSPGATALHWNVDEVYRVFSGPPNYWSRDEIDHNILQHYSGTVSQYTAFDMASIMLYAFPASLFMDGQGTPNNTHLSATDISFWSGIYPQSGGGPSPNGGGRLLKVTSPYMRGHDVEQVQEQLNSHGEHLTVDGIYGPDTAAAVRRFQQAHGLTVDGIVGPQTREALSSLVHA